MSKITLTAFTEDHLRTWELTPYIQDNVIVLLAGSPARGRCAYNLADVDKHFPTKGQLSIDRMGRNFNVNETVYVDLKAFHLTIAAIKARP